MEVATDIVVSLIAGSLLAATLWFLRRNVVLLRRYFMYSRGDPDVDIGEITRTAAGLYLVPGVVIVFVVFGGIFGAGHAFLNWSQRQLYELDPDSYFADRPLQLDWPWWMTWLLFSSIPLALLAIFAIGFTTYFLNLMMGKVAERANRSAGADA